MAKGTINIKNKKRTDFRKMDYSDFIEYLTKNEVSYEEKTNKDSVEVIPKHFRLKSRRFPLPDEELDNYSQIEEIIEVVSKRIEAMSTKDVYHPKRISPKWKAMQTTQDKLNYFEKMVSTSESSIGFRKLVSVNLCYKTLEAVIVENPSFVQLFNKENLLDTCVLKFKRYPNGRAYLMSKRFGLEEATTIDTKESK